MTAFALADDLATRLKRTFTGDEQSWVTELLEDAAEFLRGEIGYQVYPSATATFTAYPSDGWVDLPQQPVSAVTSVQRDSADVDFDLRDGAIHLHCRGDAAVKVTFTFGYEAAPRDLIALNCALVAQQMLMVENQIGLTAGGLSSVALDDFKIAFADAGGMTGLALTDNNREYLRRAYGRAGFVVGANR